MIANVDPMVNMAMNTKSCLALTWLVRHKGDSPNMPMRNGLHFVRSAKRSRKNPIESLMKLYAKMIEIE